MRIRGRRLRAGLSLVGILGAVIVIAAVPAVAGQFVGERFAPLVSTMTEAPELDVRTLTIRPGETSGQTFVVTFRSGLSAPPDGYRLLVNVGDPTGKRTRWVATFTAGAFTGTMETGDGTVWDPGGPVPVALDPTAGRATIDAQATDIPADSAVWVEAEIPTPGGPLGTTTTYFSYDELDAPSADAPVPSSTWAWVRDAEGIRVDGAARVPGAPPMVEVVDDTLVLVSPETPPGFLLDQPVTATVDFLRLLPADPAQTGGHLLLNRVTGEVQVFTMQDGQPVEVDSAAEAVVVSDADPSAALAEPPSTRSVTVDLGALARALGLPADRSDLAVTVDRAFTLGDGSVATTTGVASTVASLTPVAAQTPEPVEPVGEDVIVVEDSDDGIPLVAVVVVAAVALVALVGVVIALLVRRRRERERSLIAEGWFDQGPATQAAAPGPPLPEPPPPPPPLPTAAIDDGAATVPVEAVESTEPKPTDVDERAAPDPVTVSTNNGSHEREADKPAVDAAGARATQDRAIADLDAQIAALIERVDQLGDADPGPG